MYNFFLLVRGRESMSPVVGAVAPTGIFGIFFYIKVLEVLTIVAPTENPKKKITTKGFEPDTHSY